MISNGDSLRIGFIGVGSIAKFHAEAAQAVGHIVSIGCGTSENSPRWRDFKTVATHARFESDGHSVLRDPDIDAVIACLPWNLNESWLPALLSSEKPVLLEKPIALSSSALVEAMKQSGATLDNKVVGLNRRFYRTVQELKERVSQGGIQSAEVVVSETVKGLVNTYGQEIIEHILIYSSCHIVDTARYVLGELTPIKFYSLKGSACKSPFHSLAGVLETRDHAPVFLTILAENPVPVGLRVFFDDQTTWHLSPLERLVAYRDYDVIEPTGEVRIRRYMPKPFLEINEDSSFKPGFLAQMRALTSGKDHQISATVKQSLALLRFTEEIKRGYRLE